MSWRTLVTLTAVLLVLLGLAVLRERSAPAGAARVSRREGALLLPDLDLNRIAEMETVTAEGTNRLVRREGRWVADSLYGYPVDFPRLAEFLRRLGDMKAGPLMRGGEDLLGEFGLYGDAEDRRPDSFTLRDEEGAVLARITLGAMRERDGGPYGPMPDGRFLRVDDGPVMLVTDDLGRLSGMPETWIDRDLLDVSPRDALWVRVTHPDPGKNVFLEIPASGRYELEGLDEEKEELDASEAGRLTRALQYLRCTTVADPSLDEDLLGFEDPVRFEMKTHDGFLYTALVGKETADGNGCYVRLGVDFREPPPPDRDEIELPLPGATRVEDETPQNDSGSPAPSREEEAEAAYREHLRRHEKTVAENRARALQLHERLAPWTHVIGSYACAALTLTRDQLVTSPGEEEPGAVNHTQIPGLPAQGMPVAPEEQENRHLPD